jgi:hypothetical protein
MSQRDQLIAAQTIFAVYSDIVRADFDLADPTEIISASIRRRLIGENIDKSKFIFGNGWYRTAREVPGAGDSARVHVFSYGGGQLGVDVDDVLDANLGFALALSAGELF